MPELSKDPTIWGRVEDIANIGTISDKAGCLIISDKGELMSLGYNNLVNDERGIVNAIWMALQALPKDSPGKQMYAYMTHDVDGDLLGLLKSYCANTYVADSVEDVSETETVEYPEDEDEYPESYPDEDFNEPEHDDGVDAIANIINNRTHRNQNFGPVAASTQMLKEFARGKENWDAMDQEMREALDLIFGSISLILNANPYIQDHWRDIEAHASIIGSGLEDVN